MKKSGFEANPIGYTGFICGPKNPATGDCFWNSRVLEEKEDKFFIELEDGQKGWIAKHQFTPRAMIVKE